MTKAEANGLSVFLLGMAIPALIVFEGFVCCVLWGWFVAEPFGIAAISMAHAIGLTILLNFVTYNHRPADRVQFEKDKEERGSAMVAWELLANNAGVALWFLFSGWLVHFMM